MQYYCGLDLSSRDCQVCVIDEDLKILVQKKVRNELAITVFYEVGDIGRFKDARHFSSYCRLVPGVAQSGKSLRRCFDRHMRRHKGRARKLICYDIIAHKLAQAAYCVFRRGTIYRKDMLFAA